MVLGKDGRPLSKAEQRRLKADLKRSEKAAAGSAKAKGGLGGGKTKAGAAAKGRAERDAGGANALSKLSAAERLERVKTLRETVRKDLRGYEDGTA